MTRQPVSSSNISTVGYDSASGTLEIEFHSGGIYQYYDVPDAEHEALISAASVGAYFTRSIKNRYRWQQV